MKHHPLWRRDTTGWTLLHHLVCWALFLAMMAGVVKVARWITAAILPF